MFFLVVSIIILTACSPRYISVPEYHEKTVYKVDTVSSRDSIFIHDSVSVTHWGETVTIDKYHIVYRDRWRDRVKIDSFLKTDTVAVIKEVEKAESTWSKIKRYTLSIAIVFILVFICFILKLINKKM